MEQLPQWKLMSEEDLKDEMRLLGATDETMQERIDNFNKCVDSFVQSIHGRPAVKFIGVSNYPVSDTVGRCLMKLMIYR